MPIYEYRCGSCGFEKEYLQKVNDAPVAACPACGSDAYAKLISAAGFQLKGSGWYATDFKNGQKPKSAANTEAPAAAKSETAAPASPPTPAAGAACPASTTD
ncbi:putative regulatory protein, FmdB family [Nitrosospira briensis]|uniref:Putative regulatory protein, FmdB family n=1 Tax=Nitrosospira briensis TaxID=35799 RepID=A0A1I5A9R8_9PROT|nr:zinc ribbon domain-containing protein [Nitrosospira briensis]SFN59244.1 putative regulatory protein, FmdB family [Nitrosospira briensis]